MHNAHAHSILTTQYTQTHAYGVQQTLWYVCMCDIFNVPSEYRNDSANGLCKSQKGWKNFSWAHKNCNAYIATPSEVTLGSVAKLFSNAAPPHSHFVHIPMYDCCFRLSDQIVSVCMCNVSLLEVNTQTIFQPVIWVSITLVIVYDVRASLSAHPCVCKVILFKTSRLLSIKMSYQTYKLQKWTPFLFWNWKLSALIQNSWSSASHE